MGTLKPQSNGPLHVYSDTAIGTLAVDGRAVITNFILFAVAV